MSRIKLPKLTVGEYYKSAKGSLVECLRHVKNSVELEAVETGKLLRIPYSMDNQPGYDLYETSKEETMSIKAKKEAVKAKKAEKAQRSSASKEETIALAKQVIALGLKQSIKLKDVHAKFGPQVGPKAAALAVDIRKWGDAKKLIIWDPKVAKKFQYKKGIEAYLGQEKAG